MSSRSCQEGTYINMHKKRLAKSGTDKAIPLFQHSCHSCICACTSSPLMTSLAVLERHLLKLRTVMKKVLHLNA